MQAATAFFAAWCVSRFTASGEKDALLRRWGPVEPPPALLLQKYRPHRATQQSCDVVLGVISAPPHFHWRAAIVIHQGKVVGRHAREVRYLTNSVVMYSHANWNMV